MGRNRKTSRGVARVTYDIFGNIIAQEEDVTPTPAPAATKPVPKSGTDRSVVGNRDDIEKADTIIANAAAKVDRKAKREKAVVLDAQGNVVAVLQGTKSRVRMNLSPDQRRSAAYLTHNHPDVVTLSYPDIEYMYSTNMNAIQAQALPMTKRERQMLDFVVEEMARDPLSFLPDKASQLERDRIIKALQDFNAVLKANPGALNLTFTATDKNPYIRDLSKTRGIQRITSEMADMKRFYSTQIKKTSWSLLATRALEHIKEPITTKRPYDDMPELDFRKIGDTTNFLANAVLQHVNAAQAFAAYGGDDLSYGITLS